LSARRIPPQPKTSNSRKEELFQMTRRIFSLAPLVLLLVMSTPFSTGTASTSLKPTAAPVSCGSACAQNRAFCNSTCNNDPTCLAQCQDEYECCLIICHGGTCRRPEKGASTMKKKQ